MSYLTNQILRGAETIKRMTTTDTPRTDTCPHCGCPLATCEVEYMSCFPCMSNRQFSVKMIHQNNKLEAEVERLREIIESL